MQAQGDQRKVGYYIRVSTERQARVEEGSLKNQRQMLDAELERRNQQSSGWGSFVEAYVDEGLSGKNTNRPAFQRLMRDAEIGRIDTVMFTELSRLSRSLKDFLNIFEFAQKHQCDLVCLKTDIDTTSPYKSLITKILMIFAEFEREMTSRRTAANAYERSKRGLANGGAAPLGYRRDEKRKGHFVADPAGSKIVRALYTAYLKEQSIKRAAEHVRARHPEHKLSRSKVYSILTNKAYIGVREIYKKDSANTQEVPAVWQPIIERETFERVQAALSKNRERYHSHPELGRFVYLLSGLIRCGDCGQRLLGKSGWSSSAHRHHYYAHRGTCPKGGRHSIESELAHRLVLEWLRDIVGNEERFDALRKDGITRIGKRIRELRTALAELHADGARTARKMEARIQELTRTDSLAVRRPIEASIARLDAAKNDVQSREAFVQAEIEQLQSLSTSPALLTDYRRLIREVLSDPDKRVLGETIASLTMRKDHLKVALSPVNRDGVVSGVFVLAPRGEHLQTTSDSAAAFIEDRIPLPGRLVLADRAFVASMHTDGGLSARQVAARLGVSRSAVLDALGELGVVCERPHNGDAIKGHAPFGWEPANGRLVRNAGEQQVVRLIRQLHAGGASLRSIAGELNHRLVPTKKAGIWQANTVAKILRRPLALHR